MDVVLKRLGTLFYVVDYKSSSFSRKEEVPNYLNEAIPLFVCMVVVEKFIGLISGKNYIRTGDALTSIGHGVVYETSKILTRGAELFCYNMLYEYRLFDLDWRSPVTWIIAAIGVDFGFYWFHRASHEINLGWAAHQVHHSSEDFNLTTALRQSIFQRTITVFFYNPLALLGVPLTAVLVHIQFNLLYQFWIHTRVVDKLGPLEWVLNTPSHHRVHHGANKWCLDKNYAGVLIIWDRIFGTFQAEKEDEEIVYGVLNQPKSFNVLWLQTYYYRVVMGKASKMTSCKEFVKALFCGPGWFPGSSRLGDLAVVPDIKAPREKYRPQLPLWQEIYLGLHTLLILAIQHILITKYAVFAWYTVLSYIIFILVTITLVGAMYDGSWWAPLLELIRCTSYVAYSSYAPVIGIPAIDAALMIYFSFSLIISSAKYFSSSMASLTTKKID